MRIVQDNMCNYSEILESVKEYIETDYREELSLDQIADKFSLSKYHFHKLFKSYFGVTPKTLIERLKLERAAHLLKYTDASIIDIAFEFGYQNHETFTRAFKRIFGTNPLQYRRSKKEYEKRTQANLSEIKIPKTLGISNPTIKYLNEIKVAYIRHIGDYRKIDVTWRRLVALGQKSNFLSKESNLMGIYYDDPEITQTEKLRYDACVEIENFLNVSADIQNRVIEKGKFMVFRYTGELSKLDEVYAFIYHDYILKQNIDLEDRPNIEMYITSPAFLRQHHYITDICIPIK